MEKEKLADVYKKLKSTSNLIIEVTEETQNYIEDSARKYDLLDVSDFCIVTFTAITLFATVPAYISFYYDFLVESEPFIRSALSKRDYISSHIYVKFSSLFVSLSVPLYTLVMPFIASARFTNDIKPVKKNFTYYSYTFSLNYFTFLIPLIFLFSYEIFSDSTLEKLLFIWLFIPGALFSIVPSILMLMFFIFISNSISKKGNKSHLTPYKIIYELIFLLTEIKKYDQKNTKFETKKKLIKRLDNLSKLVKKMNLYFETTGPLSTHIEDHFLASSKYVESLKLYILLPESNSKKMLQRKTESLLNTFLSGNYSDLNKIPINFFQSEEKSKKSSNLKRLLSVLSMTTIISIPLIVWTVVIWIYKPEIPPEIKNMLPVIYSIWCLMAIFSFSEKLAPETKSLVFDVFKLLLNKK
ncbi:hypothetical protein [Marinomonas sp. ef1]|uniref:hypothetical protein n=1 Tax=Marinomonas sp. ef1 TaxID=2005043 RepID=UPI000C285AC2|nr:hypothetical protein [Marinomonas sp. ef1]